MRACHDARFPQPEPKLRETRNAVRFIDHDGMFEVRFFVEADALAGPDARTDKKDETEAACLAAFDRARFSIHDVARNLYLRGRQPNYVIKASDLR